MSDVPTLFAAACAAGEVCLEALPKAQANGSAIQTVLTIVIGIVAAISLLFIVIGGLRYVLSQGDPSAVGKAKGTIIYAVVGLIVAVMAQVIVVFVVGAIA